MTSEDRAATPSGGAVVTFDRDDESEYEYVESVGGHYDSLLVVGHGRIVAPKHEIWVAPESVVSAADIASLHGAEVNGFAFAIDNLGDDGRRGDLRVSSPFGRPQLGAKVELARHPCGLSCRSQGAGRKSSRTRGSSRASAGLTSISRAAGQQAPTTRRCTASPPNSRPPKEQAAARSNSTRKIFGRPVVTRTHTLKGQGADPAITGEPPEEQSLTTSASVEPGGSGPSQPANERPPSLSSKQQ